ncbi:MAG: AAA family ATPase, partial [Nanoarchaeota archaeon]|nr:AAA family ATPase [Nanoarchaeota archaeon]
MFLQKIEIQGFKSFASKTVFQFPAKIIGIVGPNGSGKSNIVDAFRWILGERAAKNLRGDSLGNLIFAGTPKRPAAGLARVAIHMAKSEFLPGGMDEVVLERRVDRSGNSQFFLNSAEIRLKDLAPMLARARLGTRGMTIINQGESDVFVKSSAQERRLMMEEILGLKEFRLKKSEAERKLESTKINMDKVAAMTEEIAPHLRFLKKQKERWEKRVEVERELGTLAKTHFGREFGEIRKQIEEREKSIAPLEKTKKEREKNVEALKEKLRVLESKTREEKGGKKGEELDLLLKQKSDIERVIVRIETRMELEKEAAREHKVSAEEFTGYAEHLRKEFDEAERLLSLAEIKNKIKEWRNALERLFKIKKEERKETPVSTAKLQQDLASVQNQIQESRRREEEFVETQKSATREFRVFLDSIEKERDEMMKIERRIQEEKLWHERLQMKAEELQRGWASLGKSGGDLEKAIKEAPKEKPEGAENVERKIGALREELSTIGEIDTELIKEAEETEERYEFLNKEHADLENAVRDLVVMI